MITCKEDLVNTYVKNIPELRRGFLSLAVKFGFIGSESDVSVSSEGAVVACWNDVTVDSPSVGCWFSYADQIKEECRELTLSDLKPTRTEYVQVTESIFDLRDEFERGELYQSMNDDTYEKITCESKLGELYGYRLIYRRVEKVVDWYSELDSYLNKPSDDGFEKELPTRVRITINDIEFHLTDSEYLESCRVALRANGEIE